MAANTRSSGDSQPISWYFGLSQNATGVSPGERGDAEDATNDPEEDTDRTQDYGASSLRRSELFTQGGSGVGSLPTPSAGYVGSAGF